MSKSCHKTLYFQSLAPHTPLTSQSALEILQHRYARGEIDEATYEQMRERLENTGARSYRYDNPPVSGVR